MTDFMTCDVHGCENIAEEKHGYKDRQLCDSCIKAFAYGRLDKEKEGEALE